jgi:hypothetical protein
MGVCLADPIWPNTGSPSRTSSSSALGGAARFTHPDNYSPSLSGGTPLPRTARPAGTRLAATGAHEAGPACAFLCSFDPQGPPGSGGVTPSSAFLLLLPPFCRSQFDCLCCSDDAIPGRRETPPPSDAYSPVSPSLPRVPAAQVPQREPVRCAGDGRAAIMSCPRSHSPPVMGRHHPTHHYVHAALFTLNSILILMIRKQ